MSEIVDKLMKIVTKKGIISQDNVYLITKDQDRKLNPILKHCNSAKEWLKNDELIRFDDKVQLSMEQYSAVVRILSLLYSNKSSHTNDVKVFYFDEDAPLILKLGDFIGVIAPRKR